MKKKFLVFACTLVWALMLCSCDDSEFRQTDVVIDGRVRTSAAGGDNEEADGTGEETGSMMESSEDGRHQIGETVYFVGEDDDGEKAEYNITMTDVKYIAAWDAERELGLGHNTACIVVGLHIENTGNAKRSIGGFVAYADDYEVPMSVKDFNDVYVTVSKGRKADVEYIIKIDPYTVDSVEFEYSNAVFVIKDSKSGIDALSTAANNGAGGPVSNDVAANGEEGVTNNVTSTEEQIFAFTGSWYDAMGNCNMNIRLDDEFYYIINIDWTGTGGAAMNSLYWEFKGDYDASRNAIVYQNGICYSEDAETMQKTQTYSDGSGLIYMQDGKLFWQDDKGGLAENFVFEKSN